METRGNFISGFNSDIRKSFIFLSNPLYCKGEGAHETAQVFQANQSLAEITKVRKVLSGFSRGMFYKENFRGNKGLAAESPVEQVGKGQADLTCVLKALSCIPQL